MVVLLSSSCSISNGLPADLRSHLLSRGIKLQELDSSGAITSRQGYLYAVYDATEAEKIISAFGLRPSLQYMFWRVRYDELKDVSASEVWASSGRPVTLKLANGGQFEYMYLVITGTGTMYILTEYSYG
jgi:hypothetical protein